MWNRAILPDGTSVMINSPGADNIGRAGSGADYVNRHFWERFGQATLLSILGAGVANYEVASSDQYNSASEYRSAIANSLQDAANQALQSDLSIKPTLKLYQGTEVNVFVARDLYFPADLA
jgi:type IV secretion system protein VirB10